MIIGKSLTALGGGGLKPEVTVTSKAGALLNLHYKDSSIILQSYQLGAEETQHTFVVSVSETAYMVEDATNNKSVEVLIDKVAVFNVEIPYILWLYKDGDECEEFTGGWTADGYTTSSSYTIDGAYTKNSTNMYGLAPSTDKHTKHIGTANLIDFSRYSTLKVEINLFGQGRTSHSIDVSNLSSAYVYFCITKFSELALIASGFPTTTKRNTPGGSGLGTIFYVEKTYSQYIGVAIYRVWLE